MTNTKCHLYLKKHDKVKVTIKENEMLNLIL